jgi:glucose-1-phosphate thymidylyltransferase
MLVILGDNIFKASLKKAAENYNGKGAQILIKEVPDPHRYGVPELNGDKIVGIEEKPEKPKSNYCVTGIYMYDNQVFDVIKNLKPSGRGELEITDVNNYYIKENQLLYSELEGWWTDAGTHSSYRRANELAHKDNIDQ